MMALTPKRLFLYLCISISLLRPYTLFSRSPLVNKTLLDQVDVYFLSNGNGSAFENSLDSGYPVASVPARCTRQRCWKRGTCSGDGQSVWDYCTARLSDLSVPLTGEVRRSPEPSARPSAAADSEERQICTTCLFAESVGLCL